MPLEHKFIDFTLDDITRVKEEKLADGWRAVQVLCTNCDDGIEILYSYTKGNVMENYIVHGVTKQDTVPSITDAFIGMFPFENEAHDLFGVNVEGIAIDFAGKFYDLAQPEPMTIISPEKKAARDKAAKVAAAKAAAEAKKAAAQEKVETAAPSVEQQRADFEAKIANLDPEKQAKMRAAFEAKLAKQAKEGE